MDEARQLVALVLLTGRPVTVAYPTASQARATFDSAVRGLGPSGAVFYDEADRRELEQSRER